jgi:hypothetical protein
MCIAWVLAAVARQSIKFGSFRNDGFAGANRFRWIAVYEMLKTWSTQIGQEQMPSS